MFPEPRDEEIDTHSTGGIFERNLEPDGEK
jgi:hypothetical protein